MRQRSLTPENPTHLIGCLVGFLVVAAPLAMVAWHELSEVLMGHVTVARMLAGFGALAALGALAVVLARFMEGSRR
jgi:hypothetical protein